MMKIFVLILAVIGVVSCSGLPTETDYDTANLRQVQICEIEHKISDEEKKTWWAWEIPANPTKCYIECCFAAFGWSDKNGELDLKVISDSYKAVGHADSAPTMRFIEKTCGELPSDRCDRSNKLYECLLTKSKEIQHFKDAFDGKTIEN